MKATLVGFFLAWLATTTVLMTAARPAPAITTEFVVGWLAAQGFIQGGDVQFCSSPGAGCSMFRIDHLSVATDGDAIVGKNHPEAHAVTTGVRKMESLLAALGAGTNDVLAAFLGSVCGAFALTKPTARAIISTVVVGTCVGTYFGPNAPAMLGIKPANWITFVIGSIGTALLLAAGNWLKGRFLEGGPKQ